jgi:transposase-like protein
MEHGGSGVPGRRGDEPKAPGSLTGPTFWTRARYRGSNCSDLFLGFLNSPVVHFYRNVFSHVPNTKVADVARMLKAIHAQEDRKAAKAKAAEVVTRLKEMRLKSAAELVEQKVEETLTYYGYPAVHWRQIRTNNPLERIIREIRRRTRVVGAFPDGHSALMLVAARLRHIASTKWGKRRYMQMESLLNPAKQEEAAA